MLTNLYQILGVRHQAPNSPDDYVELFYWQHEVYNPSYHLSLMIKQSDKLTYCSFSPKFTDGLNNGLRTGREGFWMPSFDEEKLIWGLRRKWLNLKTSLSEAQISLINSMNNDQSVSITHLSDEQLLKLAQSFTDHQDLLRGAGLPTGVITLRTLNLDKMELKVEKLKTQHPPLLWAAWVGTGLYAENTHNCASIILTVLNEGGLNQLIQVPQDWACILGAMLGLSIFIVHSNPATASILLSIAVGFLAGRFLGGMYEGYIGVQHFLNLTAESGQDNLPTVLGLRLLSAIFCGFMSLLKTATTFPTFLALPKKVIELSNEAVDTEESLHRFKPMQIAR